MITRHNEFVSNSLQNRLKIALKGKPVLAAVAYVSDVTDLPLSAGDTLVCDASDNQARAGATRRDALSQLVSSGVQVWSHPGLHAKVVVAGEMVIVGSANWSAHSNDIIEAAVEMRDSKLTSAAKGFVAGLIGGGATKVDKKFLAAMPDPEKRPKAPSIGSRYWLISVHPLRQTRRNREAVKAMAKIEKSLVSDGIKADEIEWVLFPETNRLAEKVSVDDQIMEIWRENEKRTRVYPPSPVIGVTHVAGHRGIFHRVEASNEGDGLTWKQFHRLARNAGLPKNINRLSTRELSKAQAEELRNQWG